MGRRKPGPKERWPVPIVLTRDQLVALAQSLADYGAKRIPRGARIVVTVTDAQGEWVGVGSNTHAVDIATILQSALLGADKKDGRVIDVHGESES